MHITARLGNPENRRISLVINGSKERPADSSCRNLWRYPPSSQRIHCSVKNNCLSGLPAFYHFSHCLCMHLLANPLYYPPTHFAHPFLGPWTLAGIEGFLWGLILWRWSRGKGSSFVVGFAVNTASLALFWFAMTRQQHLWDYDYQFVSIGEIVVICIEGLAAAVFLSRVLVRPVASLWLKALGVSVLLNGLSFFMGCVLVQSPIPGIQSKDTIYGSSPGWRGRPSRIPDDAVHSANPTTEQEVVPSNSKGR